MKLHFNGPVKFFMETPKLYFQPSWQMIGYNFSARTFKNPREQSLKIRIFMIYNNLNEIYMSQLYVPRNHYIYIRAVIEPPPPLKGWGW